MPSDTPIDYGAVLEDLKAQREKLDAAIAGIETMLGMRSLGVKPEQNPNQQRVGPGAYLGMTIVDATVAFLKIKRQGVRTEEIVMALRDGGIVFTSESPVNTVGSILNRNWNQGGEVVRVSRGVWGLAEWHPRLRKKPVATPPDGLVDQFSEEDPPAGKPSAEDFDIL